MTTTQTAPAPPPTTAHRERDKRAKHLLGRALLALPAADVDATFRTLAALVTALEADADHAMQQIPSDGCGNPLPDETSQAFRMWWSELHTQAEDASVLWHRMLVSHALASLDGTEIEG